MAQQHDLSHAQWRTSSRTNGGEACVEIAATPILVAIRDSKNPHGPKLTFSPKAWHDLAGRIRGGELDL
ncbi:MAG: hypothetical protein JWN52_1709 [Actinomycetia bacterium]|jgi:hypothetical protein|nr:hypothetical protein [Actinomycetes bacterium]